MTENVHCSHLSVDSKEVPNRFFRHEHFYSLNLSKLLILKFSQILKASGEVLQNLYDRYRTELTCFSVVGESYHASFGMRGNWRGTKVQHI